MKQLLSICLIAQILIVAVFSVALASTDVTDTKQFVSPEAINSLAKANLGKAANALREQTPSEKSIYLLREINNIVLHDSKGFKPNRYDSYEFYKSLGIAYHNLFLFLKTKNIIQNKFSKNALKYYKRSRRVAGPIDKQEINILIAALHAASDTQKEQKKATNIIQKINLKKLELDFQMQECLAAYYAAMKKIDRAIKSLRQAYLGRSKTVINWIATGDDFYFIKNDPRFQALLKEWDYDNHQNKINLTIPAAPEPELKYKKTRVRLKKRI